MAGIDYEAYVCGAYGDWTHKWIGNNTTIGELKDILAGERAIKPYDFDLLEGDTVEGRKMKITERVPVPKAGTIFSCFMKPVAGACVVGVCEG